MGTNGLIGFEDIIKMSGEEVLRQGSPEDLFGYDVSKVNAMLSSKGREVKLVVDAANGDQRSLTPREGERITSKKSCSEWCLREGCLPPSGRGQGIYSRC